jgi:choline-glycine betaine transporter
MFPLVEFPVYALEAEYSFANPLAIEFGFWGFLVWAFYFLTTFYFCIVEPKVKLFEIKAVKVVNNLIIIATCAFTGFLFLDSVPDYIDRTALVQLKNSVCLPRSSFLLPTLAPTSATLNC